MFRLVVSSAGTPIGALDLLRGVFGLSNAEAFDRAFARWIGQRWCCFVNSGTTACYLILEALKQLSSGSEVVLPAYTAPSLLLPIRKAGLTPALCDIDPSTLNLDGDELGAVVSRQTLCIMPVHMFGLPCDLEPARRIAADHGVFVVEDAASAMGAALDGKPVGTLSDVGFFSLNRGKNLTTLTGGCIVTPRADLQELLSRLCARLPKAMLTAKLVMAAKLLGLALAVRPLFYTMLYPLISQFKYSELHPGFESSRYTALQAGVGASLMRRADTLFTRRTRNGRFLHDALRDLDQVRLPRILPNAHPVFNQFPVVFRDQSTRDAIHQQVVAAGVEATTLYPYPMHRICETLADPRLREAYATGYDLNGKDPFPNATYVAQRLLLIPTHPGVSPKHLATAVEIIRKAAA